MNKKSYIIGCVALTCLLGCITLLFCSIEIKPPKEPTLLEKLAEHRRKYV
jgi:hypothetical protein